MARFNEAKIDKLMLDPGIIRNRSKINPAITNAKALIELQKEYGSFSHYLWSFVDHKPINNRWKRQENAPARTNLSDQLSKDLKKYGFKFVGSTICYAFLQTVGIVNDHMANCSYK